MKLGNSQRFNIWLGFVLIYLFIKFEDLLGVALIGPTFQSLLMYVVFAIGVILTIFFSNYSNYKVDYFILACFGLTFTAVVSTIINRVSNVDLVQDLTYACFWFVVLLVCYNFLDGNINSKNVVNLFVIFDILVILRFVLWFASDATGSDARSNSIYYMVCLFPVVFYESKKHIKYFLFIATFACTLLSGKRTALIALAVAFVIPYIVKMFMLERKKWVRNSIALIAIFAIIIISYDILISNFDITILERFENIEEDGGSGRSEIYATVWRKIKNSDVPQLLLGRGYNGVFTSGIVDTSAHNDFLEVLFDYGILGAAFYLLFIFGLFSIAKKLVKRQSEMSLPFISGLAVFVCMSLTSHLIIYPTYFFCLIIIFMMGRSTLKEDEGE